MSLPYKNQSNDLQSKSVDWFLYEWDIGRLRVKVLTEALKITHLLHEKDDILKTKNAYSVSLQQN